MARAVGEVRLKLEVHVHHDFPEQRREVGRYGDSPIRAEFLTAKEYEFAWKVWASQERDAYLTAAELEAKLEALLEVLAPTHPLMAEVLSAEGGA